MNREELSGAKPMTESEGKLADELERLCCAETEGKFFDCVTDNIQTILAALRTPAQPASGGVEVIARLNAIAPAVENLACHQEQCDEDGVMVKVSRQAVDEVVNAINQLAIDLSASPSPASEAGREPVAWRWKYKHHPAWHITEWRPTDLKSANQIEPLYASPPHPANQVDQIASELAGLRERFDRACKAANAALSSGRSTEDPQQNLDASAQAKP